MRNNQIRATVAVDATTGTQDQQTKSYKISIKVYKSFNDTGGHSSNHSWFEYKEVSGTGVKILFSETNMLRMHH